MSVTKVSAGSAPPTWLRHSGGQQSSVLLGLHTCQPTVSLCPHVASSVSLLSRTPVIRWSGPTRGTQFAFILGSGT